VHVSRDLSTMPAATSSANSLTAASRAPSWSDVEVRVESEVGMLRMRLGAGSIWSPRLCERLRSRCISHGPMSLIGKKTLQREPPADAMMGDAAVTGDALVAITGSRPEERKATSASATRNAHAWVYLFSDPMAAVTRLVGHDAFSAGVEFDSAKDDAEQDEDPCAQSDGPSGPSGWQVALATVPLSSQSRSGASKGGSVESRFIVVTLIWRGDESVPFGPGLPTLLEDRRSQMSTEPSLTLGRLGKATRQLGSVGRGEKAAMPQLPGLLSTLVDEVCAVWAQAAPERHGGNPSSQELTVSCSSRGNVFRDHHIVEQLPLRSGSFSGWSSGSAKSRERRHTPCFSTEPEERQLEGEDVEVSALTRAERIEQMASLASANSSYSPSDAIGEFPPSTRYAASVPLECDGVIEVS